MSKIKTNTFTYVPTQKLPKLGPIKHEWDLRGLYYKNEKDPQIELDVLQTEKAYTKFAKKWKNTDFTKNAEILAEALKEYETLISMSESSKPGRYFSFRLVLNAKDSTAEKRLAILSNRLRKLSDEVIFFTLEIGKVPTNKQEIFKVSPLLKPYYYFLECIWQNAKYDLSEAEEKIINLKARQSSSMWVNMVEKLLAKETILWQGKELPFNEAMETIDLLSPKDKEKLWTKLMLVAKNLGEVAEHEFNAVINDVRTEDDLRGYKKPYSATALHYEDTEKSIENLVSVVSTEGFKLSNKFYRLKADWHGLDKLHYTRKYDSIGTAPVIPFKQAVEICRDVFYGVKNEYGVIFDNMLTNGQIDVFPKAGKRGGAFMSDSIGNPTHVFLNHLENFKSLETLAHEMGHAIHAHRSKTQPPFYQGHSITTAETASTLFENLLFDSVYAQADEQSKPILLHDRMARDISTIQRQIAFFNCELEIHNTIKEQGAMTNDELRDCMYKHLKSYLGPAIALDKNDGYSYVYIPHLRYGFYVYTYSFGILISTIMANHYKADKKYVQEIDKFLSAGASDSVANIFKSIGIDTTKQDIFSKALLNQAADIDSFAKMVKAKKKKQ